MKKMKRMRGGDVSKSSTASKASSGASAASRAAKSASRGPGRPAGETVGRMSRPSSSITKGSAMSVKPSGRYQGPSSGPSFKGGIAAAVAPKTTKTITSIGGSKAPAKAMNRPAAARPTGSYRGPSAGPSFRGGIIGGAFPRTGSMIKSIRGYAAGGIVGAPARSYKDMKAGAGSGVGRIQKTKIQRGR